MNKQNIKVLSFKSDGFLAECKPIRGGTGTVVQGLADGVVMMNGAGSKGWEMNAGGEGWMSLKVQARFGFRPACSAKERLVGCRSVRFGQSQFVVCP